MPPKEPSISELEAARRDLLRATLSGSCSEAWPRVRQHLIESPSILPEEEIPTVWEGPNRGWLLPLPFESLRDFVRKYRQDATEKLVEALKDPEPLVVGYALHALSQIEASRFGKLSAAVEHREEGIHTIFGSFGWEGSLAEYAIRLREEP